MNLPHFTDGEIQSLRGPKNHVSANEPYAYLVEPEVSRDGLLEDTGVIFISNRECPFRCLMCDLWRNTLDERVPVGSIAEQIDFALSRMSPVQHLKLYNSGNFFDAQAIPPQEHSEIARRMSGKRTLIVENHPLLCGVGCLKFRDLLPADCELEIAIGLETAQPDILARLNKRMTVGDFRRAVEFLGSRGIATRAFILLRPPFVSEDEGVEWALKSIDVAFSAGVRCCCVIPTRSGNGIMERLQQEGQFASPCLRSLELVLETALSTSPGRIFADLWDLDRFAACPQCKSARQTRLQVMNHTQKVPPAVQCHCWDSQHRPDPCRDSQRE